MPKPSTSQAHEAATARPSTTVLTWLGPLAFSRRYAGWGADQDFGDQWGHHRDQRITHRHQLGADTGLLYVYDSTWNEYAVLGEDVSLAAVGEAVVCAQAVKPHLPVTDFAALLAGLLCPVLREHSHRVEL